MPAAPLLAALIIASLLVAGALCSSPQPTRQPCSADPSQPSTVFSQSPGSQLTTVAVSDDSPGPTTLVAAFDGIVYVYNRTISYGNKGTITYGDFVLLQTLQSNNSYENASFGLALDLEGDWLAIGQPQWKLVSDTQNANTGAVILYKRAGGPGTDYVYFTILYEEDTNGLVPVDAQYGQSVALANEGTTLLVGAPGCCEPEYIGNAFTYVYGVPNSNVTEPEWYKTNGPAQTQVEQLGQSVVIAETTPSFLLMGAPGYTSDSIATPGVYIAPINTLTGEVDNNERSSLPTNPLTIPPGPDLESECGFSMSDVDPVARTVLWSCPGFANASGAVYTSNLVGSEWSTTHRVQAPTPVDGNRYGQALAFQSPIMIASEGSATGGNVYQYEIIPVTLKPEDYLVRRVYSYNANGAPTPQNTTISVAFSGNVLAVGAFGSLYIYDCPLASAAPLLAALVPLTAALAALLPLLL